MLPQKPPPAWTPSERLVLRELRARCEATTSELVEALGLSAPTVRAAVRAGVRRGLVEVLPPDAVRPGRPTPRFRFLTSRYAFVGVNIDDVETVIRVAGLDGRPVGEVRVPGNGRWTLESCANTITETIANLLPSAVIATVALAVPAWVERDGTMRESPAMPELGGVPLRAALEHRFGCRVLVENDVQVAAVAEHRFGASIGTQTSVYLWAGQRVNAAVYVNGRLHRGNTGIAGAVGSQNRMEWGAAPLLRPTSAHFAAVADGRDDELARPIVQRYVDALSSGLSALTLALDPELIVLAGHTPSEAALLSPLLEAAIRHDAFIAGPKVVAGTVGADARVVGALSLASELGERQLLGLRK